MCDDGGGGDDGGNGGWVVIVAAITTIDQRLSSSSKKKHKNKCQTQKGPVCESRVIIISNRISRIRQHVSVKPSAHATTTTTTTTTATTTTQLYAAAAAQHGVVVVVAAIVVNTPQQANLTKRASVAISIRIPLCVSESADPTRIILSSVSKSEKLGESTHRNGWS